MWRSSSSARCTIAELIPRFEKTRAMWMTTRAAPTMPNASGPMSRASMSSSTRRKSAWKPTPDSIQTRPPTARRSSCLPAPSSRRPGTCSCSAMGASHTAASGAREPLNDAGQPLFQGHLRAPAEPLGRLRGIGVAAPDVARARRRVAELHPTEAVARQDPDERLRQLGDGGFLRRRDMKDLAADARHARGLADRPHQIVNLDEVAGLAAITIDLERLAGQSAPDESSDHAALAVRIGSVNVAEAQGHGLEAEAAGV